MLRKILCAVTILAISLSVAMAETIKGKITKIDGNKITVVVGKETKELEASKDVKLFKMDGKEKVKVDGGLPGVKVGTKGKGATLEVTDGKVTEITFPGKKK